MLITLGLENLPLLREILLDMSDLIVFDGSGPQIFIESLAGEDSDTHDRSLYTWRQG
jgi:hypothetical protein